MDLPELLAKRKSLDIEIAIEEARSWFFRSSVAGHLIEDFQFTIADLELVKPIRGSRKNRPVLHQNLATGEVWDGEGESPAWRKDAT